MLLYCCESTYPTRVSDRICLDRVQKYCARLFLRDFRRDVSYSDLLSRLNWEPLYRSVFSRRLLLVHSYVIHTRQCPPDSIKLLLHSDTRSSRRNPINTIVVPRYNTVRYAHSAFAASVSAYNMLPSECTSVPVHIIDDHYAYISVSNSRFKTALLNISQQLFGRIVDKSNVVSLVNI